MQHNEAVSELSEAICDVINSFSERISISELLGVLNITKHIYIMEAIEQDDTNEDDTE
jgi:hypothetical protein